MDFNEIHNDTHSFLMTKIEKFKPSKEKRRILILVQFVKII
jgi:hypothetical protein